MKYLFWTDAALFSSCSCTYFTGSKRLGGSATAAVGDWVIRRGLPRSSELDGVRRAKGTALPPECTFEGKARRLWCPVPTPLPVEPAEGGLLRSRSTEGAREPERDERANGDGSRERGAPDGVRTPAGDRDTPRGALPAPLRVRLADRGRDKPMPSTPAIRVNAGPPTTKEREKIPILRRKIYSTFSC